MTSGERSHFTGRRWGAAVALAGKRLGAHGSGRQASGFEAGVVRRGSQRGRGALRTPLPLSRGDPEGQTRTTASRGGF